MVTQIATAATEQTSSAEQITANVEEIAKVTRESASGAQQSAKACEDLSNLAIDLQHLVGRFKLETSAAPEADAASDGEECGEEGFDADAPPSFIPGPGRTNGHGALSQYEGR